jgi:cation diffusion facilitator family transporter
LKLWVGRAAGSVAMVADAWHTMSDTLTSLVVIAGFWLAARPTDREHPFGHGRAELIGALVIGTMLGLVGFNFLRESWRQLRDHQAVQFGLTAMIVFAVSVLVKEALAQFSIRAGRRVRSQALIADGWHHRSDAFASALIVIGALAGRYFWWVDGVLGILVSLLILYAAVEIVRGSASILMGERPDTELAGRIAGLVAEHTPAISNIHHLHVHRYGDHVEVTLHVTMPEALSLKEAHDLSSILEERIRDTLKVEPTIHLEPRRE